MVCVRQGNASSSRSVKEVDFSLKKKSPAKENSMNTESGTCPDSGFDYEKARLKSGFLLSVVGCI